MALEKGRGFHPDNESFGAFLMSEQALDPVRDAAKDVARIAQANEDALDEATSTSAKTTKKAREGASRYAANFKPEEGPVMTFKGNPRRTMRVVNDKPYAGVREFGHKRNGGRSLRRAGGVVGELRGEIG